MSNPPQDILTLLARTGAASSTQIGKWSGLAGNDLQDVLSKLAAGQLIAPVGQVKLSPSGRPQKVWSLLALGARRAGLYFSPNYGRESLIKGLLKTHFVLSHQDGYYPLFFADQVALFEERGEKWPWKSKDGPMRVGAQIRIVKDAVHVALALATPKEARQLLEPPQLSWAKRTGYRLTLLIAKDHAEVIPLLLNPMANWNDSYCQQKKTYREWRAALRALLPEQEHYRHHIERVLKWAEKDNAQESTERYDLVVRAFPEPGFQPELLTLSIVSFKLLESVPTTG